MLVLAHDQNYASGAATPVSSILSGFLCAGGLVALAPMIQYVPKAALVALEYLQVLALQVLHDHVRGAVFQLADVEHAANVGVRHLARHAHLVEQTFDVVGVGGELARQELQRHLLAELQVVSAIDLTHTATPKQGDDSITPGHRRAGKEASMLTGVRE